MSRNQVWDAWFHPGTMSEPEIREYVTEAIARAGLATMTGIQLRRTDLPDNSIYFSLGRDKDDHAERVLECQKQLIQFLTELAVEDAKNSA
jgi:hypothetical protein